MAKTIVVDAGANTRVPFLRGILTRSLQNAGLPFKESYEIASRIRDKLDQREEVTTEELRAFVLGHLDTLGNSSVTGRYRAPKTPVPTILVRGHDGGIAPFSAERHRRCLSSCGLSSDQAAAITAKMYDHLMHRGTTEIDSRHLLHLTYRCLNRVLGSTTAHRYLVWTEFTRSDRPLIILIGGTPGCGKSTVATEIANRLDIVRSQSTDMLREVMRMMIPEKLAPVLHMSSFDAWQALPNQRADFDDLDAIIASGYGSQAEMLAVASEAVIQRAITERVSLILEGVHVYPGLLERLPMNTDAIVVTLMMAVLKPEKLRQHITGRGNEAPGRRAQRYLEHFDEIWRLQTYLLSEADRHQVPIVANEDKERAVADVLETIVDTLGYHFRGSPKQLLRGWEMPCPG